MIGRAERSLRDTLMLGELARVSTLHVHIRRHVKRVLRLVDSDVTKAARVLGIGRATLYRLVAELGIETKGARQRRETAAERARLDEAERLAYAGRKFTTL